MRVRTLHECGAPKCNSEAVYAIQLDNGKKLVNVCSRHRSWGADYGRKVEAS